METFLWILGAIFVAGALITGLATMALLAAISRQLDDDRNGKHYDY